MPHSSNRSRLFLVVTIACAIVVSNPSAQSTAPSVVSPRASAPASRRAEFLTMFARGYFPGRTGQLFVVPREGHVLTRPDPSVLFMHGSPWEYDTRIPIFFVGAGVTPGRYTTPALQQDVSVTLASVLGVSMPATATGRVLPGVRKPATPPRAVLLTVLDGMRVDYFDRYANDMPVLSALRKKSAWFTNARVNYLPTNTGAGHATLVTGGPPRVHGITGNNLYDRVGKKRYDMLSGWNPRDLLALTLSDVWQLSTRGRARIVAQGSSVPASVALAGHGACQVNGVKTIHAGYDELTGDWRTDPNCFDLPSAAGASNSRTLWPADGLWMGHRVDTSVEVRRSALFPKFEADTFINTLASQPIGDDDVTDLLLVNYKGADYVGHKHGPDSPELRATLVELDRHFGRIVAAIEQKVGPNYLLAFAADHGMPGGSVPTERRHFAPDVLAMLNAKFDPSDKQLVTYYEPENAQIFVDMERLASLRLTLKDLAEFLQAQPYFYAVFTEDEVRARVAP